MCLYLYVGFLEFYPIIYAVLSHNIFVCAFLENTSYSRTEEIYFAALAPDTAAINSASVELVATAAYSLLL